MSRTFILNNYNAEKLFKNWEKIITVVEIIKNPLTFFNFFTFLKITLKKMIDLLTNSFYWALDYLEAKKMHNRENIK